MDEEKLYKLGEAFGIVSEKAKDQSQILSKLTKTQVTVNGRNITYMQLLENAALRYKDLETISMRTIRGLTLYGEALDKLIAQYEKAKSDTDKLRRAKLQEVRFAVEMETIKQKKLKATQEGFTKMMIVRYNEMKEKVLHAGRKVLGIQKSGSTGFLKMAGVLSIALIILNALKDVLMHSASSARDFSDAIIRSGGLVGRSTGEVMVFANRLYTQLSLASAGIYSYEQALAIYNEAVEAGALSLEIMYMQQQKVIWTQEELNRRTMRAAIELKAMSMALFGTENVIKDVYDVAIGFRINIEKQMQTVLTLLAASAGELQIPAKTMLEVMSVIGDKMIATGTSVLDFTLPAMLKLGSSLRKILAPAELERAMKGLKGIIQQFDVVYTMAVMKGPTEIGERYTEALRIGPLKGLTMYLTTLEKQMRGQREKVAAMALALPEFKRMGAPGIALIKGILGLSAEFKKKSVKDEDLWNWRI